ncbi:hypothetical protein C8Q77DRAFT_1128959 [Trametes polyzona]|nr:hypothetical protein C8Q77DRAFT_1128959 [Trametes polyzona]
MDSTGPARTDISGMRISSARCAPVGREVLTSVEGIVLHVNEYEGHPPEALSYSKSDSRTISVGRRPSQGYAPDEPERALFRCPVVSRKHAKITFTEYGNVYITDLHSHHGTHILRPGELVCTALKPEVPTVLADGDVITFGKTVGRDSFLVRPVVVRVQLVFGRDAFPRAPSPLPRSLSNVDSSPDKASTRTSTGRYGVHPASSESSSSASDGDSDLQEISPPASPCNRLPSFDEVFARPQSASIKNGRLRLLQSILPPIHVSPETPPPEVEESFFEQAQVVPPPGYEEEDMDLSSSRSSSPADNNGDDVTFMSLPEVPPIVGAWPGTSSSSSASSEEAPEPVAESRAVVPEVIEISDDEHDTPFLPAPYVEPELVFEELAQVEDGRADADMPLFISTQDTFLQDVEIVAETSARVLDLTRPDPPSEPGSDADADAQTAKILDELKSLRSSREGDEAAFSAHVQDTKERLNALDGRMLDTQTRLVARDDQLTSIQTRLQGLGDLFSDLRERSTAAEREAARVDELVKGVEAAKDILRETYELQRETGAKMAEELDAVRALRAEAAATVAEAKRAAEAVSAAAASLAAQAPASLKRKRNDAEDDMQAGDEERPTASLPSKRRRTLAVVSKVAQTATVATVGAVAAWAALAFS